jgi:hypothetical protein
VTHHIPISPAPLGDATQGEVASVLLALGRIMHDLQKQDLALQKAIASLASNAQTASADMVHLQHVDLVTQTHEDLARFLPELAACLERTGFDQQKLSQKLRLRSLQDQLLAKEAIGDETDSGDVSFF